MAATTEFTATWNFRRDQGCPLFDINTGTALYVIQENVGGEDVDIKLEIDASASGSKFSNANNTNWTQTNAGLRLSFPSKSGATVQVYTYINPETSTVDGQTQTGDWTSSVATFNVTGTSGTSVLIDNDGNGNQYFRWLKVTYPASSTTAIDNTNAEAKAVKRIVNGQLVIEKNGVRYNALGAEIK